MAKSGEQIERERAVKASKVCPCGKDASDMIRPGVGSCSICHQRLCCAECSLKHRHTEHATEKERQRFRKQRPEIFCVNGFDAEHYGEAIGRLRPGRM